MRLKAIIIFIALISIYTNRLLSQGLINKIPNQEFIGARPIAMGETFVAVADDINAIYWNPAGLPAINQLGVNSMHTNLFQSGVGLNYLSLVIPGPYQTSIGVDWMNIGFDDQELEFGKNKFNFSLGYQLFDRLSLGINVKYIQMNAALDNISQGSFNGWGLDASLLYSWRPGLKLGLVIHDLTHTRLTGIDQPIYYRNVRVGAAYELFDNLLIAMDLDDRIHFGSEWLPFKQFLALRGGVQRDLYTDEPIILSFGFGLDIPIWGQRVRFDYALTDTPTLLNTHRTSLSILIDLFPRLVKIKKVAINPVYASLYKYYEKNPIGQVDVEYKGKKDLDCTLSIGLNKYGNKQKKNIVLPAKHVPENVQQLNIISAFNDSILFEPDDIPLIADIKISYMSGNRPKEETVSQQFTLLRRNRIDWQYGVDQAAAFITPEDPTVIQFNRNALVNDKVLGEEIIINEVMTNAIRLFDGVAAYGIQYEADSYSPYRLSYRSLDNILYPAQLLKEKRGDCDDLSVLFASIFENRDIPTALVSVPSHIFLLFNSGIHPRRSFQLCCAENLYVEYQNQLWIPLETTYVNRSFCTAWEEGANQLKKYSEQLEIIEVRDAWQIYKPIAEAGVFIKSFKNINNQNFTQDSDSIKTMQQKHLNSLERKLAQYPDSSQLRNMLAIKYVELKNIEMAKKHIGLLLASDSTNFFALNNLGNLFFMNGNLDSAQYYYLQASEYATGDFLDGIYLNLGLLYAAADLDNEAVEIFAQVMKNPDDYQRIGNLLGFNIDEDDLTKAAELRPQKKVDQITVKQLTNKARDKKTTTKEKKKQSKKTVGDKGHLPKHEIENIFYWAF